MTIVRWIKIQVVQDPSVLVDSDREARDIKALDRRASVVRPAVGPTFPAPVQLSSLHLPNSMPAAAQLEVQT